MENSEIFLNQYRLLEEELSKKYSFDYKSYGSPVVRFINDRECKPFKDKLNLCREIRNLLSHHSDVDGESILEPSNSMIEFLKYVTDYVKRPPLALEYATLYDNIMKGSLNQRVKTVIKRMEGQGYSHIPVMSDGKFAGVFSISTIFTYINKNDMKSLHNEMTIGDFSELLPVEKHTTERFKFVGREATMFDVKVEFENKSQKNKRLAVIFITDNGSKDGRILGMLTPWDILGKNITHEAGKSMAK